MRSLLLGFLILVALSRSGTTGSSIEGWKRLSLAIEEDQTDAKRVNKPDVPSAFTALHALTRRGKRRQDTDNRTGTCSTVTCPGKKTCRERKGRVQCTCKLPCLRVERQMGPVCGSDGRTYRSLCSLHRANCRSKAEIRYLSPGLCRADRTYSNPGKAGHVVSSKSLVTPESDLPKSLLSAKLSGNFVDVRDINDSRSRNTLVQATCKTTTCPRKKVCREGKGRPSCTCKLPCTPVTRLIGPVCGSDGRTYRTVCLLHRADCRAGDRNDIYLLKPANCNVDFKKFGNSPVPLFSINDLPAAVHIPTPPPGSLEEAVFSAPARAQADLISDLLRLRIQQTVQRKKQNRSDFLPAASRG